MFKKTTYEYRGDNNGLNQKITYSIFGLVIYTSIFKENTNF